MDTARPAVLGPDFCHGLDMVFVDSNVVASDKSVPFCEMRRFSAFSNGENEFRNPFFVGQMRNIFYTT